MRWSFHKKRGFTLIEMIVSLMIFSIVAVVALSALMKIIDTNIKAQSLQDSVTNLNFALDAMSREIRTGSKLNCMTGNSVPGTLNQQNILADCINGVKNNSLGVTIAFVSTRKPTSGNCNLITAYSFSGSGSPFMLQKGEQTSCNGTVTFSPILNSNIALTNYIVQVTNATYPLAFIHLSGYAGANGREKDKSYFDVQTAVSPRTP